VSGTDYPTALLPRASRFDLDTDPTGQVTRLERRGPQHWVILYGPTVLGRDGQWHDDPLPSSRSDAYRALTQFPSWQEALTTWESYAGRSIQ
jgi:hypothetical protein